MVNYRDRAAKVVNNYRNSICGMGPFFDKFIQEALHSREKRAKIAKATETFFNTTYFHEPGRNDFPFSSKELLGLPIYHEPCNVPRCDLVGGGSVLLGSFEFTVTCVRDDLRVGLDESKKTRHDYTAELAFFKVEQFFLFMRALWYYTEAKLLQDIISSREAPALRKLVDNYTRLRHSLISPFLVENPSWDAFKMRRDVLNKQAADLDEYYNQEFFSRMSFVQQRCSSLARLIRLGLGKFKYNKTSKDR